MYKEIGTNKNSTKLVCTYLTSFVCGWLLQATDILLSDQLAGGGITVSPPPRPPQSFLWENFYDPSDCGRLMGQIMGRCISSKLETTMEKIWEQVAKGPRIAIIIWTV